jgi:hypothetical protein
MNSTLARPARRFALTLATAGIAVLGSVAIAPAASAAPAGESTSYIVDGPGKGKGNGPDAFIVTEHGRIPVFFCDDSGKHDKKCTPTGEGDSGRF